MNFSRVLSETQIEEIHHAAETLLEETGFRVQDEDLVRRCAAAGAAVGEVSGVVRFPRALLRELVAMAPPAGCELHIRPGGLEKMQARL